MFPEVLSSEGLAVKDLVIFWIVPRRRGFSLATEVVELPRELRRPEKEELLSKRADEGLWMTWSLTKLTPSIDSVIEEPRLCTACSGIVGPPVGGEPLGVWLGEAGGDRFEISIMALVALLLSSPLLSETTWFALSAVTTGSAA